MMMRIVGEELELSEDSGKIEAGGEASSSTFK